MHISGIGMDTHNPQLTKHVHGLYALGTRTVPEAIELLGQAKAGLPVVAILRDLWHRGGADFKVTHQDTLAKRLGISRATAQRALDKAVKEGYLKKRKSNQKTKVRGYLCEYKIVWEIVLHRLGYAYDPVVGFAPHEVIDIANDARCLPSRWFERARFSDHVLYLVLANGQNCQLPEHSDVILKYLIESHFGKPIADTSLKTYLKIMDQKLTPRLLSLIALKLYYSKTKARSEGYYTAIIKDQVVKARKASQSSHPRKKTDANDSQEPEMILIEYDCGPTIEIQFGPEPGTVWARATQLPKSASMSK